MKLWGTASRPATHRRQTLKRRILNTVPTRVAKTIRRTKAVNLEQGRQNSVRQGVTSGTCFCITLLTSRILTFGKPLDPELKILYRRTLETKAARAIIEKAASFFNWFA
jgi:hypothetical protein